MSEERFRIPIPDSDNVKAKSFLLHFLLREKFIAARRLIELLSHHSKNLFRAFNIAITL